MVRNFVVGFGGTGARCLEAVLYLAASGVQPEPIHMLIIDPDGANGNLTTLREQMRRYHSLQKHVASEDATWNDALFSVGVNHQDEADSGLWEYPAKELDFQTLLELQHLEDPHRRLVETLFDDSDMKMRFGKGYVGRAHVGSLDLLRVLTVAEEAAKRNAGLDDAVSGLGLLVTRIEQASKQPGGVSVVVVGSVFGGTGASGLPAFPRFLDASLSEQARGSVSLSAVLIAPYFGFPPGVEGAPQSSLHPLATQASLYHYAYTAAGYDRLYLVGAPVRPDTNEANVIGGPTQLNAAHYVELGVGLAAVAAFSEPPKPHSASVDVRTSGTKKVEWNHLPQEHAQFLQRRMAVLGSVAGFHSRHFVQDLAAGRHRGAKWHVDLESDPKRRLGGKEVELTQLGAFGDRYLGWCEELSRHQATPLFTVGDLSNPTSIGSLLKGHELAGDAFHEIFEGMNRNRRVIGGSGVGHYMRTTSRSAHDFCARNFSSWWRG